jgi:hypothetical protein
MFYGCAQRLPSPLPSQLLSPTGRSTVMPSPMAGIVGPQATAPNERVAGAAAHACFGLFRCWGRWHCGCVFAFGGRSSVTTLLGPATFSSRAVRVRDHPARFDLGRVIGMRVGKWTKPSA